MVKTRLNGWQRLWIVMAVLWIAAPVVVLWDEFPTEELWRTAFEQRRVAEIKDELRRDRARHSKPCPGNASPDVLHECFQRLLALDRKYEEVFQAANSRLPEEADRSVRDDLPAAQARSVGLGIVLWIVPVLLAYGLGLTGAWVRRGFRSGAEN